MISLLTRKKQKRQEKEIYQILAKFYRSFFDNMYNELNIGRYRQIRDAISLVMLKFETHDHPLAYSGKLVMYIEARVAMKHLPLTKKQQGYMQKLNAATKHINLNYIYTSPIDDEKQFLLN